jgi:hypothetical protein
MALMPVLSVLTEQMAETVMSLTPRAMIIVRVQVEAVQQHQVTLQQQVEAEGAEVTWILIAVVSPI